MAKRAGNWLRKVRVWESVLLFHGQDREQNFTKFFTELCAAETPNTPVRSMVVNPNSAGTPNNPQTLRQIAIKATA
jgi:hypothetical protein